MRKIIAILVLVSLSGCSSIVSKIPSFWDDNQSSRIIDVRLGIERMDCSSSGVHQQVSRIRDDIRWFQLYSESKGLRQTDVQNLVKPLGETVEDMYSRSGQYSRAYCEIKVRILKSQSQRAAEAILGRF